MMQEKVTPIRPPSNGVSDDSPQKREHEQSKSHVLVSSILGAPNLTTDKKIEALASVLGHAFSPAEGGDPKPKNNYTQLIVSGILALIFLVDMFAGVFGQDNKEILDRLDKMDKVIVTQNAGLKTTLEHQDKRFENITTRLDNIEGIIAKMSSTDEEQGEALSDYIESEGHKIQDLPDSVRLVMLRNEQAKLEARRK